MIILLLIIAFINGRLLYYLGNGFIFQRKGLFLFTTDCCGKKRNLLEALFSFRCRKCYSLLLKEETKKVMFIVQGILFLIYFYLIFIKKFEIIILIYYLSLFQLLILLSISDFYYLMVPRFGLILLLFLFVGYNFMSYDFSLLEGSYSAFVIGAFLFLISYFFKKIKKIEGLGIGDVYLYMLFGFNLGLEKTLLVIWVSCLFGLFYSLHKKPKGYLAFIPFLSLAYFIIYFYF